MSKRFYPKSVITRMNTVMATNPPWGGTASAAVVARSNIYGASAYVGPVLDMMTGLERPVIEGLQVTYFPDYIFASSNSYTSSVANRTFRIYNRHTLELLHTVVIGESGSVIQDYWRLGPTTLFIKFNRSTDYLLHADGSATSLNRSADAGVGRSSFGAVVAGFASSVFRASRYYMMTTSGLTEMGIDARTSPLEVLHGAAGVQTFPSTASVNNFVHLDGSLYTIFRKPGVDACNRLHKYHYVPTGPTGMIMIEDYDAVCPIDFAPSLSSLNQANQSLACWEGVGLVSVSESHGVTVHDKGDLSLMGTLLGPGALHTVAETRLSQCGTNLCIICNTNPANESKRIAYLFGNSLNLLWQRPVRDLVCLPTGTIGNFGAIGDAQRLYVSDGATRSAVIDVETSDPVYIYTDRGGRFNDRLARLSLLPGFVEFPQRLGRRIRHLPEDVHPNT